MPIKPDLLANFVPLNSLSSGILQEIATGAEERRYAPGEILFREGERDSTLFFLLDGEILRHEPNGLSQRMKAGEESARYALARTKPHLYTAEAATPVRVLCVDEDILEHNLCCDQAAAYEVFEYEGDDDPGWIWDVLTQPSFRKVPHESLNAMFQRFEPVRYEKGQVVIRQGEEGDYYYLIREGRVAVSHELPAGSQFLAELNKGEGFGEEALLSGQPRNATITMMTDGLMMRLAKRDFDELLSAPLVKKVDRKTADALLRGGHVPLDVRLEDEFRTGTIRGSLNLPLYLLRLKAKGLDRDKKYLLFCQNGQRSRVAAFLLSQRGFDVCVLDGGLAALGRTS